MRNVLGLTLLPLSALFVVACSADSEEPLPSDGGDAELALSTEADDAAVPAAGDDVDKGRRGDRAERRRHRRGRHHHGHGGTPPPPPAGLSCEVAGQAFPDGSAVPSGDSCNTCACNDGSVICTLALCEPSVCAAFIEESDGVCSRFPLDPCISQDPDCVPDAGACEAAGETFPDGSEVPSGDSCNSCSCSAGNVVCTRIGCEPVACAEFIEEADGVCSRFPLDPCKFQDPDCADPAPAP